MKDSVFVYFETSLGLSQITRTIYVYLRDLHPEIKTVILWNPGHPFFNSYMKNYRYAVVLVQPEGNTVSEILLNKRSLLDSLVESVKVVLVCYPERSSKECKFYETWATEHGIPVSTCSTERGKPHVHESDSSDDLDLVYSPGVPKVVGVRDVLLFPPINGRKSKRVRRDGK